MASKFLIAALSIGVLISPAMSQFSSGSTGADGAMNITEDTVLDIPPNGIFNFTTFTIANSRRLTFNNNALNTPVYILATGDITIGSSATIDVSGGKGSQGAAGTPGPGGFAGGHPAQATGFAAGDGFGPGRGIAPGGRGAYGSLPGGTLRPEDGQIYGNSLLVPLIGGSGGAGTIGNPGNGGSGGGGAILFASSTRIDCQGFCRILAQGGSTINPGSGGAVRLVAPVVVGGSSATIDVRGSGFNSSQASGDGRIRVDTLDRSDWNFSFRGRFSSGQEMYVFPENLPELHIIEAAGTAVPEGTGSSVQINLADGTPTTQSIRLRAKDFTGVITVEVVATPENGESTSQEIQIDMAGSDTAEATVSVEIPAGTTSHIHAWTK